jgi:hypothetical protein
VLPEPREIPERVRGLAEPAAVARPLDRRRGPAARRVEREEPREQRARLRVCASDAYTDAICPRAPYTSSIALAAARCSAFLRAFGMRS